ncbi:MAG: replication-relaxation family protein [Ktedonobacteraceae bacterium]
MTARDAAILVAVYQYRALTSAQIEALFFSQGAEKKQPNKLNTRCQYRLQMLYHHGFLFRDEQPQKLTEGRKPLVYWLDEKGAQFLAEETGEEVDWSSAEYDVSYLFLTHLLAINEVRVSITLAAQKHGFVIRTWLDDKHLKSPQMKDYVILTGAQGGKQKAAVVPDGYFLLDTGQHLYHHFLELDRGMVTGAATEWGKRDWARKVAAYLEYYRSGKYEERYKTQGLRILTVTTSEKRLSNLKAITEKTGGRARFWFTTLDHMHAGDILTDGIWQVAGRDGLHALTW